MIHRFRPETQLERRIRLHNEAQRARILTFLLLGVLAAALWMLLCVVDARGGWMALF